MSGSQRERPNTFQNQDKKWATTRDINQLNNRLRDIHQMLQKHKQIAITSMDQSTHIASHFEDEELASLCSLYESCAKSRNKLRNDVFKMASHLSADFIPMHRRTTVTLDERLIRTESKSNDTKSKLSSPECPQSQRSTCARRTKHWCTTASLRRNG